MNKDDDGPFAIRNLWPNSSLLDASVGSLFPPPDQHLPSLLVPNGETSTAFTDGLDLDLAQQTFAEASQILSIPSIGGLCLNDFRLSDGSDVSENDQASDIWSLDNALGGDQNFRSAKTWERFYDQQNLFQNAQRELTLITEANDRVLDGLFARRAQRLDLPTPKVVQFRPLLDGLLHASVGRSSLLFPIKQGQIVAAIENTTFSGHSLESSSSFIEDILQKGNLFLNLRAFAETACSSLTTAPSTIALARAMDQILDGVEEHVTENRRHIHGIVALRQLLEIPFEVVSAFSNLIARIEQEGIQNDQGKVLATVLDFAQRHEYDHNTLQQLSSSILRRVGAPFLEIMSSDLGMRTAFPSEQLAEDEAHAQADSEAFSHLLNLQDQRLFDQTRLCKEFMARDTVDHPAANPRRYGVQPPGLEWCLAWSEVERIESKALRYENDLVDAIAHYSTDKTSVRPLKNSTNSPEPTPHISQKPFFWDVDEDALSADIHSLDLAPKPESGNHSSLSAQVKACLTDRDAHNLLTLPYNRPPVSLTPGLSVSSLLRVQNRILSYTVLHSIIHKHNIQLHFKVHAAFSLFSSGTFASRLNEVLFSTATKSSARKRGVHRTGGTMGLNLSSGTRRAWPPASSEIRLALVDVLSDCWAIDHTARDSDFSLQATAHTAQAQSAPQSTDLFTTQGRTTGIPGALSFAIRSIPEEGIPRILDPHGLYALDFLRLSYTPPSALAAVFTSEILETYDKIFALLLRLLRIQFVVFNQMAYDLRTLARSTTYRNDSEEIPIFRRLHQICIHLVTNLREHFTLWGITAPWTKLTTQISKLAQGVQSPVPPASDEHNAGKSLAEMTILHSETLSTIAGNLLLRRRQRKAAAALENVLGDILSLARAVREKVEGLEKGDGMERDFRTRETEKDEDAVEEYEHEEMEMEDQRSPDNLQRRFDEHVRDFLVECAKLSRKVSLGEEKEGDDGARSAAQLLSRLDGGNGWAERILGESV